jgi:hypothetical protein
MKRLLICILVLATLPLLAQEATRGGANRPAFTPEREAAALSFVKHHHPELGDLLLQLKSGNRGEYQRAINEMFLASERLAQSKERDPLRYELDLQVWKIDSRIRLIAARMAMADSDLLQGELKDLLLEKIDAQHEIQKLERERLSARLEKLDAAIERNRSQRESQAQQALAKVMEDVQKSRPSKRPAGKKNQPEKTKK